jgi:hypothetical protein
MSAPGQPQVIAVGPGGEGQWSPNILTRCPNCYALSLPADNPAHMQWHADLNSNMAAIQSRISLSLLGGLVQLKLL